MDGIETGDALANSEELRRLYRSSLPHVYGYLLAHTGGNRALAEELTSETFVHAAAHFGKGRSQEVTMPWLITVAKRRLIDFLRREERLKRRIERLRQEMHVTTQQGDSVDIEAAVYEALGRLQPDQRLVLVLKHLDGLTVAEIAETIGRSHKGVEAMLTRARAAFRKFYKETGNA